MPSTPTPARPLQDRLAMAPPVANPETPGGSGGFGMHRPPPAPPPGADAADGRERLPPLPPRAAAYAYAGTPDGAGGNWADAPSPPLDDGSSGFGEAVASARRPPPPPPPPPM